MVPICSILKFCANLFTCYFVILTSSGILQVSKLLFIAFIFSSFWLLPKFFSPLGERLSASCAQKSF